MPDPIITDVEHPASVVSGAQFDVLIHAHDPDAGVYTLEARVLKDGVVVATFPFTQEVTAEALQYALADTQGAGFQITQDPVDPALFHCVAP